MHTHAGWLQFRKLTFMSFAVLYLRLMFFWVLINSMKSQVVDWVDYYKSLIFCCTFHVRVRQVHVEVFISDHPQYLHVSCKRIHVHTSTLTSKFQCSGCLDQSPVSLNYSLLLFDWLAGLAVVLFGGGGRCCRQGVCLTWKTAKDNLTCSLLIRSYRPIVSSRSAPNFGWLLPYSHLTCLQHWLLVLFYYYYHHVHDELMLLQLELFHLLLYLFFLSVA